MISGLSSRWSAPLYQACLLEISCIIQRPSLEDIFLLFTKQLSLGLSPSCLSRSHYFHSKMGLEIKSGRGGTLFVKGLWRTDPRGGSLPIMLLPEAFLYPPHTHPQPQDQVTLQPLKPCLPSKTAVKGLTEGNTDLPLCPGKCLSCFFQVEWDGT